ncbi:polysaccharide deacetylase family protein [Echinicola sp. 20G]|uniref:polysaccharide deacetylase family protein n=1 Tax=Echinicola sp. 20G TaxID=2781961 RepID=UPI00191025F7|nr:polysaccharide deacetylase family protein [Echinicola sp. 20G]
MNILTFDIEDWFHILDNPETATPDKWEKFENRLHKNMDLIFSILEEFDQKATFFCLGWVAEKYPEVIRQIAAHGHEIGSHTTNHKLIFQHDPDSFVEDLVYSIKKLEDVSGQRVRSFRAPGFSIMQSNAWAFEKMLLNGIEIDCSVFPANRSHGGFPEFGEAAPSWIEIEGMRIKEFPINLHSILGKKIVFSGGGYLRLFPYSLLKSWTSSSNYTMTYFHPRDFDASQPIVPGLSKLRQFKSYYGLNSTEKKLRSLLTDFEFIDLETADKRIDWSAAKVINLDLQEWYEKVPPVIELSV